MNNSNFRTSIRYVDIRNLEKILSNLSRNITFDDKDGFSDQDVRLVQTLVTLEDIFDLSPPTNDLFNSCTIRMPNSYSFQEIGGKDCHSHFKIGKFYLQEFVCYRFEFETVKKLDKYQFRNLAYALAYPGMFYGVAFNVSTFLKADYVKVIVNPVQIRPYRSAAFAPSFWRRYNPKRKTAKYNWFTITYGMLINKRLPPPFNTSCVDYQSRGFIDANDCIRQCLIYRTKSNFNLYPYSVLIQNFQQNGLQNQGNSSLNSSPMKEKSSQNSSPMKEKSSQNREKNERTDGIHLSMEKLPLDLKTIVVHDLETNETIGSTLYNLEESCSRSCSSLDCEVEYSMTQVSKEPQMDVMAFQVNTPQKPTYKIHFHPKTKFIEYFIYVLSCFGTWFGLSILSLNPFRYTFCCSGSQKTVENNDVKIFDHSEDKEGRRDDEELNRRQTRSNEVGLRTEIGIRSRRRNQSQRNPVCYYCLETSHILMRELRQELSMITFLLDATGHRIDYHGDSSRSQNRRIGHRFGDQSRYHFRNSDRTNAPRAVTFSSRHRLPPPLVRVNGGSVVYEPTRGDPIMPRN